jgi:hypothetical protein
MCFKFEQSLHECKITSAALHELSDSQLTFHRRIHLRQQESTERKILRSLQTECQGAPGMRENGTTLSLCCLYAQEVRSVLAIRTQ